MASKLCFRYSLDSLFSHRHVHSRSTITTNQPNANLNFRYNNSSSLQLSISCKSHRNVNIPHTFISFTPEEYDENEKSLKYLKYKQIVRWSATSVIFVACALSNIGFNGCKLAIAGPKQVYQKAPPVMDMEPIFPMGGKAALQSLLDVTAYLASSKQLPETSYESFVFDSLPERPSMEDINNIKIEAIRLMKVGEPEEALEVLYNACYMYKDDSEPSYNLEMALVEILISQGKFDDALECPCLHDDQSYPSDVRLPLYKAIIYTMQDKDEEARLWWKIFRKTIGAGINPSETSY